MSRSRRKHPIGGITYCSSESYDKHLMSHRERVAVREWLANGCLTERPIPIRKQFYHWGGKDGKWYFGHRLPDIWAVKLMRK